MFTERATVLGTSLVCKDQSVWGRAAMRTFKATLGGGIDAPHGVGLEITVWDVGDEVKQYLVVGKEYEIAIREVIPTVKA